MTVTVPNVPSPFVEVDATWNRWEELGLPLLATAGSCRIKLGPNFPGGDSSPTGLANDATVYTATVIVDGLTEAVSIVGSAAQTIATLVTELNTDLSAAVVLEGDEIVITSTTTGAVSSVFVSDTGANFLFAGLRGDTSTATPDIAHYGVTNYDSTRGWFAIAGSVNRVGESVRGNTKYLLWNKLRDWTNLQRDVAGVVDRFLDSVATSHQDWVNAAASIAVPTGAPSMFTETGLSRTTTYELRLNVNGAGNVTVFINLGIPQTTGAPFDQLVAAINAGIAAAGLPVYCAFREGLNATQPPRLYFQVLNSNTPFTPTATGDMLAGADSSLVLTDGASNGIVAALVAFGGVLDAAQAGYGVVNFNRVNALAVLPATVPAVPAGNYDATITVSDSTGPVRETVTVTVAVTAADSMTVIAASLETALQAATTDGDELVIAIGNKFLISEVNTGFNTQVEVTIPTAGVNPDLFRAIAAALDVVDPRGDTDVSTWNVDGFATPGVNAAVVGLSFPEMFNGVSYANWLEVLARSPVGGRLGMGQFIFGPTGYGPLFTSDGGSSFEKELRPQSRGECVVGMLYWDGAAWRYFVAGDASRVVANDTSAGTNNPPQTLARGL